jgi:hypothetical protein
MHACVLACFCALACAARAAAQTPATSSGITQTQQPQEEAPRHEWLPSTPLTFFHGRLVVSGDVSITYGTHDKGYFDNLDYYHNAFSVMRLGVSAAFRASDHISFLTQVIDDVALRGDALVNVDRSVVRFYALFVRVRPWTERPFDVQVGRIPPVFGAFSRQAYGVSNPLIGVPLAYQYQTTLRGDSLPGTQAALLDVRGRGWSVRYTPSVGPRNFEPGMPIISSQQYDAGVQAHWGTSTSPIDVSASITNGTLGYPQTDDNNSGKQFAARVAFRPTTGLVAGISAARGEFLDHQIDDQLPDTMRHDPYTQRAFGVDAEYSRGYWLFRGESIVSQWRVPPVGPTPRLRDPLRAWASFAEATWRVAPRWYLAGRAERMTFSDTQSATGQWETWDGNVTRVEIGAGYTFKRNIRAKIAYQHNWRDARRRTEGIAGVQLLYWF